MEAELLTEELNFEAAEKLSKDLKQMSTLLGQRQVRALVGIYYQTQDYRTRTKNQTDAAGRGKRGHRATSIVGWLYRQHMLSEKNIHATLGAFSDSYAVGQWAMSICGIGPVISAGLLAHLDVRGRTTPCPFWSFAGLDPTKKWLPKTKRPWNNELKCLVAGKMGECFVKFQNNKKDYYGQLFRRRRDLEEEKNNSMQFTEQAARALEEKNYRKDTDAYKAYSIGKLPAAHLHARARRYAVKMFLSHLHYVMYHDYYGVAPQRPPIFTNENLNGDGRHVHFIEPPNFPFESSGKKLKELYDLEPV